MFSFHPREVSLCGRSGSGKTSLALKLIQILSSELSLGYAKHSGHRFDIDHPGKDTHRAHAAGAAQVYISSESQSAAHGDAPLDFISQRTHFSASDLVIAEGWKYGRMPRMIMVADDAEAQAYLDAVDKRQGEILCWITPEQDTGINDARPTFWRDDTSAIADFIRKRFEDEISEIPTYGLVLAGGKSSRMKQDKASLQYKGRTQLENAYNLLAPLCEKTYVSAREAQREDASFSAHPIITDRYQGLGPMGGILSAMAEHPEAAWCVLACDLPFLEGATLEHLLEQRSPYKVATAYISANDGLPEPLCAVYEPNAQARLWQFVSLGFSCPRKLLINSNVKLIPLQNSRALDNVNQPQEYEAARAELNEDEASTLKS